MHKHKQDIDIQTVIKETSQSVICSLKQIFL